MKHSEIIVSRKEKKNNITIVLELKSENKDTEGDEKRMEENKKKAVKYVKRLADGKIPKLNIEINYSESKSGDNDEASFLMVKEYWRNSETASSSTDISSQRAFCAESTAIAIR